jgi:hypothetical protein
LKNSTQKKAFMSEGVNTVVQKVFEYDWKMPIYIIPMWGRAEAVRAANKLRALGYIVRINNMSQMNFLNISRQ